jgi:hypothetical protein
MMDMYVLNTDICFPCHTSNFIFSTLIQYVMSCKCTEQQITCDYKNCALCGVIMLEVVLQLLVTIPKHCTGIA